MPDSTAQEAIKSSDKLVRFWIALCGACVVFGAWSANLSINQTNFQQDMAILQGTIKELALQTTATSIQTRTYQEGAIQRNNAQDAAIDRLTNLLNQVIRDRQ